MTESKRIAGVFVLSLCAINAFLASAASAAALFPQAATASADATPLAAWSHQVWDAAKADDLARVNSLLGAVPPGQSDAAAALRNSVERRRLHEIESEATRQKDLAKRTADLAAALATGDINGAMVHAVNMKFLLPSLEWRVWLDSETGKAVEAAATAAIANAKQQGDLLLAQEILFRQKALHDGADTKEYKALDVQLDELNRHVLLIAEFAPRELYRLRTLARARLEVLAKSEGTPLDAEDAEMPEYNELFADDWKERVAGITPRLVLLGLKSAASEHVTNAGWKPLLQGGLSSVESLLNTPQLVEKFPGLADPAKVQALRAVVEGRKRELAQINDRKLGASDYQSTIAELLSVNESTVGFPSEVILREFGEGGTTQLSKEYEDDYSQIIWPDELRRFRQSIEGNFVGVGILLRHNDKRELLIVNPLEGSPASRAGIRPGDRILAVDDQSTVGWATNRAVSNITGPVGKMVKLTIGRDGIAEPMQFSLKRASIKMRSVNGWWKKQLDTRGTPSWDWWIDPVVGIGYVRLTSFNEDSLDDFMDAIRQMKRERTLNGLILDLRGNPGGLLKSAVSFVNLFVPQGEVVSVQDREGNRTGSFSAERARSALAGLPLVVLVNNGSASASEIVSGSLQVHGAAVILGERSFGKGSVQTVQPIEDGVNEGAVKVTTQYYVLPPLDVEGQTKGRLVHRRATSDDWGVNPDLVVKVTPPQAEKSGQTRLAADLVDEADRDLMTVDLRPRVEDLLSTGIDPQLEMAVMILEARLSGDLEKRHLVQLQSKEPSKVAPQ